MSDTINDTLIDEALELEEYWTGTQYADQIRASLEANDLEHLYQLVRTARLEMLRQEYNPDANE